MSFVKKIWKDRISQFPNRRTINDGHTVKRVTVGRDEGVVTEEGTPFDATEMNDLENRIFAAIEQGGGGGGSSGTYDYSELFNKPRVNNVELNGNKTTADLHINYDDLENKPDIPQNATELPISSSDTTNTKEYIDTGLSGKADSIFESIKSGGYASDLNLSGLGSGAYLYSYDNSTQNIPQTNTGGFCLTFINTSSVNYGSQFAFSNSGIYYRARAGGSWGTWRTL